MVFVLFLLAVSAYVAFLVWCFLPIFRPFGRRWVRWLRVAAGVMLLAGNISPIFAWPLLLPINYISGPLAEQLQAVVLFARTVPIYVRNVLDRQHRAAHVVDVRYPMEIAGVRYAPVVRTTCTTRRMLDLDYGVAPIFFANFPTPVGGELVGRAGTDIIAFYGPKCPDRKTGQIDSKPPQLQSVFIIRGEAEKTQFYHVMRFDAGTVVVDDIVLLPPEIVSIKAAPAAEVIPVVALWPMSTRRLSNVPEIVERYMRLPAGVNGCVEHVLRTIDLPGEPPVRRSRPTKVPKESRSNVAEYCRDELGRYIPQSEIPMLQPQ